MRGWGRAVEPGDAPAFLRGCGPAHGYWRRGWGGGTCPAEIVRPLPSVGRRREAHDDRDERRHNEPDGAPRRRPEDGGERVAPARQGGFAPALPVARLFQPRCCPHITQPWLQRLCVGRFPRPLTGKRFSKRGGGFVLPRTGPRDPLQENPVAFHGQFVQSFGCPHATAFDPATRSEEPEMQHSSTPNTNDRGEIISDCKREAPTGSGLPVRTGHMSARPQGAWNTHMCAR